MTFTEEEWRPQPSRKLLGTRIGVCACDVCAWRSTKIGVMVSGGDAFELGAVVICGWCRRRLGINARELAESGGGTWGTPKPPDVWQGSLVRHRRTRRWARVHDFPPGGVRINYEGVRLHRRRFTRAGFLETFEILRGAVRISGST